ncbi:MAG: PEGA domain-containing protein, partial [Myxococcota bacterium]
MAQRPKESEDRARVLALLGLPDGASPEQRDRAARVLQAHIRARLEASTEPVFRAAREAELDTLQQALEAPDGRSASIRRWPRPVPQVLWLALLALAAVMAIRVGLADRATASHPGPPPVSASLSVLADPTGATFWLLDPSDESVLTRAPADGHRTEWPSGDYRLRVEHSDCPENWSQDIRLPPGGSKVYAPRLCQGEGRLIVRGEQTDDRVRIDGLDAGSTGENPHALRTGKHQVNVEKSGFTPWQADVSIRPGEVLTLLAALEPQPPEPDAGSTVSAPPPQAATDPAAARGPQKAGWAADGERPKMEAGPGLGGSKTWHDAIKHELVTTYDRNGSRSLDSPAEVRSIPCPVWQNIEAQYETGGLAVDM